MSNEEREKVILEVEEPLPIVLGITLSPGAYVGMRGRYWMGLQYFVELTAGEVESLGGDPRENENDKSLYEVTRFVRLGKITVL